MRVSVSVSSTDAQRIADAARVAKAEAIAVSIESSIDGSDTVTLTPLLETAVWIARLCASAGIGAGSRFAVAASEGEFR